MTLRILAWNAAGQSAQSRQRKFNLPKPNPKSRVQSLKVANKTKPKGKQLWKMKHLALGNI